MVTGLLIGLGVLGAAGSIAGGVSAKKTGALQARQARLQQQAQLTQASVERVEREKKLQEVLATQRAMAGAAGIDFTSGTFSALREDSIEEAANQQRRADLLTSVRFAQAGLAGDQARAAGTAGLIKGIGGAVTSLAGAGMSISQLGSVPGATTNPFSSGVGPLRPQFL